MGVAEGQKAKESFNKVAPPVPSEPLIRVRKSGLSDTMAILHLGENGTHLTDLLLEHTVMHIAHQALLTLVGLSVPACATPLQTLQFLLEPQH